ncbi:glutathione S-transferase family protein [Sphingosinicella terrae]|uniref:glutathione S-transferase family protein n=1 Tax=Sphingosinicella terrae TaxID=2172047 RepID=UPI000E0D7B7C|nr:glutathione S-transferase family protein [Sphingosinicella terrae]
MARSIPPSLPRLRLLGRPGSINVRKLLWTLAELELDFVHEPQWGDPPSNLLSPEFRALNPNGLVPVLLDGDAILWESNTICRYLAARSGRRDLLPDDPRARAEVERWMDWQATDLNAAWNHAFMALVRRHPDFADPAAIRRSVDAWNARMILLDRRLAETGAFAAGAGFTLADIVLVLSVHRWRQTPIDRPDLPSLAGYFERLSARPAVAGLMVPGLP